MIAPELAPDGETETVAVTLAQCAMCHWHVPADQTLKVGGRILCFGCVAACDPDDDEPADK